MHFKYNQKYTTNRQPRSCTSLIPCVVYIVLRTSVVKIIKLSIYTAYFGAAESNQKMSEINARKFTKRKKAFLISYN